jgi:hypothetical protein
VCFRMMGEESLGWGDVPTEPEQPIVWREVNHDVLPKCSRSEATHLETKMWNSNVRVFFSCPETWELFFSTPHEIVAIDCEGMRNSGSEEDGLPLLIQVASPTMVILQFPSDKEGYREEREGILPGDTVAGEKQDPPAYTPYFLRLLEDPDILKVFYDPTGEKREVFPRVRNTSELLEAVASSGLDLKDRYSNSLELVELLQITTGKIFETQSRKVNGWSRMRATKTMKHDKRYLIHTAANAWGILHSYLSLRRVFMNQDREPPRTTETEGGDDGRGDSEQSGK